MDWLGQNDQWCHLSSGGVMWHSIPTSHIPCHLWHYVTCLMWPLLWHRCFRRSDFRITYRGLIIYSVFLKWFLFFLFLKLLDSALPCVRAQKRGKFWGSFLSQSPGKRVAFQFWKRSMLRLSSSSSPPGHRALIILPSFFADCFNLGAATDFDRG